LVSKESGIPETYIEEEIWCTVGFKLSKAEMIDRERKPSRGSDEAVLLWMRIDATRQLVQK
jgi:hypothetical protein